LLAASPAVDFISAAVFVNWFSFVVMLLLLLLLKY